jgi:hypothetical protein
MLRRRDKAFLYGLAVAGIAAALIGWGFSSGGGSHGGKCVSATVPSTMGGAVITKCGAAAVTFCRENASDARIAVPCRKEGF